MEQAGPCIGARCARRSRSMLEPFPGHRAVFGMNERECRSCPMFCPASYPRMPPRRGPAVEDLPSSVEERDGVRDILDKGAESPFTERQRLVRTSPTRSVTDPTRHSSEVNGRLISDLHILNGATFDNVMPRRFVHACPRSGSMPGACLACGMLRQRAARCLSCGGGKGFGDGTSAKNTTVAEATTAQTARE